MTLPIPLHYVFDYTDVDRRFWDEHLADWLPAQLFDAHTHVVEPEFRRSVPSEEKRRQYWVGEVNEPIGAQAAARCQSIVFPDREFSCLCFPSPDLNYDLPACNQRLQVESLQRGWFCLAVTCPDWPAEHIARLLNQAPVVGIKPYYTLISNDPTTRDKHLEASIFDFLPHHHLEVLNERRAWVTLHVPKADRLGHPANIAEIRAIRRRYPQVVLVIAHLGRCYTLPHAEEAFPQLADDQGLYFDCSAVMNPQVHHLALKTFGPKRIVYGSDNPVFYMRGRRQYEGTRYINRTSYPFHFNRQRESPQIEAGYTLYMYEELWAIRQACEALELGAIDVAAIFHDNALRLIHSSAPRPAPASMPSASQETPPC